MKKSICIHLQFFYKKTSVSFKEEKIINSFINDCENYYNEYFQDHIIHSLEYFKQLDKMIYDYDVFKNDECLKIIFCFNIYVLTKLKLLKDDDDNGIMYIYKN